MPLRSEHAAQCPACFGPRKDGDLPEGATEVHVAVDANFTQLRHHKAGKYDFQNITPSSFLPDQYVEYAKLSIIDQAMTVFELEKMRR